MLFLGTLALSLNLSSINSGVKKPDTLTMELSHEKILSKEEEIRLANEVINTLNENIMPLPQEIFIYDQNINLIQHITGSKEELQQNLKLQAALAENNFLMESGDDKYYLKGN
ncbi:hypothetical protein [Xanthovirga aplysinae]|uniref:hypothetical protein n=1 Tax=Xanthovirga aplysinae TaxID=2529853 RepID=UPI0016571842|nr:hypothetical protein [Xanthovirga aplysinae]MTI29409.1 hypothetical protein [Xanthovirga aplysinae]